MKFLFLPLLALTCFAGSQHLLADCPRPPQGLPGPLAKDYISTVSNREQPLEFNFPTEVRFQTTTAGPVGISHPDDLIFIVEKPGVYLICWSVNAQTNSTSNDTEFYPPPVPEGTPPTLELDLLVNGNPANPVPISTGKSLIPISFVPFEGPYPFSFANLSGQVILELEAGDNLRLEATAFFAEGTEVYFNLMSNIFDITRIGDLPSP